jgi:hypothetical protein
LYQVAGATANSQYVIPPLFSKKVAVFKFILNYSRNSI